MPHPKVVKKGEAAYEVYIGRGAASNWGNPFIIGVHGDRNEVIQRYEDYLRHDRPDLIARLPELAGKTLACFCAPKKCHGEVLIKLMIEQGLIDQDGNKL